MKLKFFFSVLVLMATQLIYAQPAQLDEQVVSILTKMIPDKYGHLLTSAPISQVFVFRAKPGTVEGANYFVAVRNTGTDEAHHFGVYMLDQQDPRINTFLPQYSYGEDLMDDLSALRFPNAHLKSIEILRNSSDPAFRARLEKGLERLKFAWAEKSDVFGKGALWIITDKRSVRNNYIDLYFADALGPAGEIRQMNYSHAKSFCESVNGRVASQDEMVKGKALWMRGDAPNYSGDFLRQAIETWTLNGNGQPIQVMGTYPNLEFPRRGDGAVVCVFEREYFK